MCLYILFICIILLVVSCVSSCIGCAYLQDGLTPLMLAAQFGSLSVAELLVEKYTCNVNEKSDEKVSRNDT